MAIDVSAAFDAIAEDIEALTGTPRVFTQSKADGDGLPVAFNQLPAVLVTWGGLVEHGVSNGIELLRYDVRVTFVVNASDMTGGANQLLTFVPLLLSRFDVAQITLGGVVTVQGVEDVSEFGSYEYGGTPYPAIEFRLRVRQDDNTITPSVGD